MQMLERVKDIMACPQKPNPTYAEIFTKLARFYLERRDPLKKTQVETSTVPRQSGFCAEATAAKTNTLIQSPARKITQTTTIEKPLAPKVASPMPQSHTRYIPASIKNALYKRSGGQCEYLDPGTSRRCECTRGLQFEHAHPYALGGPTTLENMKLFCATHNALAAIEIFGRKHMSQYVKSIR
jgi:hypothetical protein